MAKANAQSVQDDTVDSATDNMEVESVLEYSESIEDAVKPPPLPAGQYEFQITGAKTHVSNSSGNKSLAITLEIDSDAMPADYVSQVQVDKKVFTTYKAVVKDDPQSRYNLKMLCQQLRLPLPTRQFDINTLVGCTGKVEIKHGKDLDGETREEVGRILKN